MSQWWERKGKTIAYPKLLQGDLPHCVYAAIAGAVNHLAGQELWTPQTLFGEHQKEGRKSTDFSVADTAITPVWDNVEKHHHNTGWSQDRLTQNLISQWLDAGSVVIISMELRNDSVSNRSGWHMFSLVAEDENRFQVWDSNGYEGFLIAEELSVGFAYPNGWFFMPHDSEDTLVLKPKDDANKKCGNNQ
jgi:hypothetical protein